MLVSARRHVLVMSIYQPVAKKYREVSDTRKSTIFSELDILIPWTTGVSDRPKTKTRPVKRVLSFVSSNSDATLNTHGRSMLVSLLT